MQVRSASAEIDVIIHATEDHLKMLTILQDVLKIVAPFTINRLEGHYGNEIIFMRTRLDEEEATKLLNRIIDSLNIYDKEHLLENLSSYIEKSSLYIRLSKQDLFMKRVSLAENDAIKIRFRIIGTKPTLALSLKEILSEEHG